MIAAINLQKGHALLQDDQILDITNMLNSAGEDVSDIVDCVSFVCGPDHDGNWHTGLRRDYKWQGNQ